MVCPQCRGIEGFFDEKWANRELKDYRKRGPRKTTQLLVEAIAATPMQGKTLLDIGGGVGAIQHELLRAGVDSATAVDASTGYIKISREEAQRQGHGNRIDYLHGDFVDHAATLEQADIVTLDRVICCYHDVEQLVGESSRKSAEVYGLVFPRDNWAVRAGFNLFNLLLWIRRSPFRLFVHSSSYVDSLVRANGLERRFKRKTMIWQVVVYGR
jgi:magnesium-protoporphyrin O-methyltransferase